MSAYTENDGWFKAVADRYEVVVPIRWEIGFQGSNLFIDVPKGYVFDVSIPRLMTWLFNRHDRRFLKAAAVHDHILDQGWSRVEAAGPFHQALVADKVTRGERLAMFLAVALFKYA